MKLNDFLFKMFDLINKSNNNINIKLTLQKGCVMDIIASVNDDVIMDTSVDIHCPETEQDKMNKIINAISEYC